jgi:hypothetical protein
VLAASTFDLIFQIGSLAATGAFVAGTIGPAEHQAPVGARQGGRGVRRAADAEQAAEMHEVQERMRKLSRLDLALIAIAVFCMATARYWLANRRPR